MTPCPLSRVDNRKHSHSVRCARPDCTAVRYSPGGTSQRFANMLRNHGWRKINVNWYCPGHGYEEAASE